MYSPATSRTVTLPAGIRAVRLKGAAIDSTGVFSSAVPTRPALTAWACTKLMRSTAAESSQHAVAPVISCLQVPMTPLTYSSTFWCAGRTRSATCLSSGAVLAFNKVADAEATCH